MHGLFILGLGSTYTLFVVVYTKYMDVPNRFI